MLASLRPPLGHGHQGNTALIPGAGVPAPLRAVQRDGGEGPACALGHSSATPALTPQGSREWGTGDLRA